MFCDVEPAGRAMRQIVMRTDQVSILNAPVKTAIDQGVLDTAFIKVVEKMARRVPAAAGRTWPAHAIFGIIALAPAVFLAADLPSGVSLHQLVWLPDYALLNYCQGAFSWLGWQRLKYYAPALDEMLSGAPDNEQAAILRYAKRCSSPFLLVGAMLIVGGSAVVALVIAQPADDATGTFSLTVSFYIVLTGVIGGHSAFYVLSGCLLYRRIIHVSQLKFSWPAPINTPGMVGIYRSAGYISRLGLVLFVIAQIPLTVFFRHHRHSLGAITIYFGGLALTAGFITITGLILPLMLSRRMQATRDVMLISASRDVEDARASYLKARSGSIRKITRMIHLSYCVRFYQAIDSAETSYLSPAVLAQYLASIAAVAIQFTAPILFK